MKKIVMLLAAAVLVTGCMPRSTPSHVQAVDGKRGQHMGNWNGKALELSAKLKLNDDQKAKITSILEQRRSQMKAIREDTTLSKEQRMAKIMELRKGTDEQIDAVLTPEQKTQLDQLRKETRAKMKERMEKDKAAGTENPAAK